MRRPWLNFALLLLAAAALFLAGQRFTARWCAGLVARSADDLDWLRTEFKLTDAELARIRQLHEGYLPQCRTFCARIATSKHELEALLAFGTNTPAALEQKLIEIGTLRAQCQTAMLLHFQEVSRAMSPEQGRRYSAEMQRLTLGLHEQIERTMPSSVPSPHAHH